MIKFLHFDFLAVLYRKERKVKNAVYRFLISLLVPEIFKFKKLVNYANLESDDVIYSTQFQIEYINRANSVNFLPIPLKLGTIKVLKVTHLQI